MAKEKEKYQTVYEYKCMTCGKVCKCVSDKYNYDCPDCNNEMAFKCTYKEKILNNKK